MFKKILHILTYNGDGDGDNISGDGVGMGTMSRGWGGDGVVSSSPCQSLVPTAPAFDAPVMGEAPLEYCHDVWCVKTSGVASRR